jgi:hypothetical protein
MQTIAFWVVLIGSVLAGLSLLPAAAAIIMSPMAFDSDQSNATWALVLILWAYPLTVISSIIGAWWAYGSAAYGVAMVMSALPWLHIVVWLSSFAIVPRLFNEQ